MGSLLHGIGTSSKILTAGSVHNWFGPGQNLRGSSGVLLARPCLGNYHSVGPTVPPNVEQEIVTAAVCVLPWAELDITRVFGSSRLGLRGLVGKRRGILHHIKTDSKNLIVGIGHFCLGSDRVLRERGGISSCRTPGRKPPQRQWVLVETTVSDGFIISTCRRKEPPVLNCTCGAPRRALHICPRTKWAAVLV